MSVNKTTNALKQTIEAKIQRRRFTPEQKHAIVVQTYSPEALGECCYSKSRYRTK